MENITTYTSVLEYAQSEGISPQAVYQQINRRTHKEILENHVAVINGRKMLDSFAVEYLRSVKTVDTVRVVDETQERIKTLEAENSRLKDEILEAQKIINAEQKEKHEAILALADSKNSVALLEVKQETSAEVLRIERENVSRLEQELADLKAELEETRHHVVWWRRKKKN